MGKINVTSSVQYVRSIVRVGGGGGGGGQPPFSQLGPGLWASLVDI